MLYDRRVYIIMYACRESNDGAAVCRFNNRGLKSYTPLLPCTPFLFVQFEPGEFSINFSFISKNNYEMSHRIAWITNGYCLWKTILRLCFMYIYTYMVRENSGNFSTGGCAGFRGFRTLRISLCIRAKRQTTTNNLTAKPERTATVVAGTAGRPFTRHITSDFPGKFVR